MDLSKKIKIKWNKRFGKKDYGDVWKEVNVEWYEKIHNGNYLLHNDFKNFLKSKSDVVSVLEIGCGSGIYPIQNKQLFEGKKYTGIDFSESAINYCKKHSQFEFFDGDFIKMKLENKFDFVFSHAVVDHVYDINEFLKNIIRVTKKYAYINSYRGYFPDLDEHKMKWDGQEGCYFNDLSIKVIEKLLIELNLRKEQFVIRPQESGQIEKNLDIQTVIEIDLTK